MWSFMLLRQIVIPRCVLCYDQSSLHMCDLGHMREYLICESFQIAGKITFLVWQYLIIPACSHVFMTLPIYIWTNGCSVDVIHLTYIRYLFKNEMIVSIEIPIFLY